MLPLLVAKVRPIQYAFVIVTVASFFGATLLAAPASGASSDIETITSTPLAARQESKPTRFQLVESSHTGVDFVIDWNPRGGVPIQGLNSPASCGGVSIGDYDGDGRPDLFLTRPFGGNKLYRNLGDFRFQDVTQKAGLTRELDYDAWGAGSCFVDINNDGKLDLYVCSHGRPNRLYINQGDGTFIEQAHAYGLDFSGASVTMAFADFDRDGDLDAYLVTNWLVPQNAADKTDVHTFWESRDGRLRVSKEYEERFDVLKMPSGKMKVVQGGQRDHFYRNDGGKFTEATREVLGDYSAAENFPGLAARWFDYDNDGYPDLYVSNDFYGSDQLFHNNRDGTMTDVAKTALSHTPWYSMGSDAADINNDGRLDFMASDMAFTSRYQYHMGRGRVPDETWFVDLSNPRQQVTNALYINTGTSRFIEAAALAGISNTDWTWAVKFGDFDNDGRVDLYVTNGAPRNWTDSDAPAHLRAQHVSQKFADQWEAYWKNQPLLKEKNAAFRNLGDLRFQNAAAEWNLDFEGVSFGSALGDLDGDGNLDIVTVNFQDPVHIYRNEGGQNHRVVIRLQGTKSNRQAIGAVVEIETDAGLQVRDLPSVRGFMSADDPKIYFGLGQASIIQRLTVRWPSGSVQHFEKLAADRLYTITESASHGPADSSNDNDAPMFVERDDLPKVMHAEQPFDDFAKQSLLPRRLSKLGPGIACADVNGDGLDDFYLAAAKGSVGQLLLGSAAGFKVDSRSDDAFEFNRQSEELAPLFFDADGDGDQDLYVVNGSVEDEANSERYQDRLYLNEGDGRFVPAPDDALPDMQMSGSVVVAADFDHDGDLDLFVGGRTVPNSYPLTPRSALLRNEGGRFVDVTDELAPGLRSAGMVTSAIWSDVDGDGWPDLLVTTEWGPVELWHNDHGRLSNATQAAGLAELTGWWNGIAAGDLDHDGNMDYVVTNFGLNTRYHATKEHPVVMFSGDMDGDGFDDIIEAEYVDENLFPVRDKTSLTSAMPWWLDGESMSFRQFAKSTLVDLFGKEKLDAAKRLEATNLDSGVLMNNGHGHFEFHPLPRIAQVSAGFGPAIVDVDGDGNEDVYFVQNFYNSQREVIRMDGGVSQLLLGDGKGGLLPVPPHESGLVVPGDAKALCITDLNHDGRPDFLVTVNDGALMAFENRAGKENRMLTMRLSGRRGNPTAVGARVTVQRSDGMKLTEEVHCGGGYLSQSAPTLYFGLGANAQADHVNVRWPDGTQSNFPIAPNTTTLTLKQPEP